MSNDTTRRNGCYSVKLSRAEWQRVIENNAKAEAYQVAADAAVKALRAFIAGLPEKPDGESEAR